MAAQLELKNRSAHQRVTIPVSQISRFIEAEDSEGLYSFFRNVNEDPTVHDAVWLRLIVNWTPKGGLPMTEMAKWMKLAVRVADLDEDREGSFTLSDYQVKLIWDRLNDDRFKLTSVDPAFVGFILDLKQATGRSFPEEEPESVGADK